MVASVGVRPRVPQPLIEAASGSTFDQPLDEPELTAELDHWERNQSHLWGAARHALAQYRGSRRRGTFHFGVEATPTDDGTVRLELL